jgi:NitT/TauT family transport system substrate-binding protein
MKKIVLTRMLILMIIFSSMMTGCATGAKETLTAPVKIASLNGPTGIGMVKLMEETEKYQITMYQSPDEVVGKIISGEVDVAAVPSNLAAVLYNKLNGDIVLVGTNTLGVLYIVENGDVVTNISDLKGKTIVASGKGGTPEFILNQLLLNSGLNPLTDVTVNWLMNHTDVASTLMANKGTVAMLPQPFTTIVTEKSSNVKVAVDLNEEWRNTQDMELPMGVLIAQKSFVESREADLAIFLNDYASSVDFVNTDLVGAASLLSKYEIIPDEIIAKKAIPLCNIVFINSQDGKTDLENFYKIISSMDPKSIGGTMPDENFYFKGTK